MPMRCDTIQASGYNRRALGYAWMRRSADHAQLSMSESRISPMTAAELCPCNSANRPRRQDLRRRWQRLAGRPQGTTSASATAVFAGAMVFQKLVRRVKQLVASCGRITSTALQPPVWDVVSDQDHAPSYAHRSGASACLLRCLSSPTLSTNRLDRQPCQRQAYDPWGCAKRRRAKHGRQSVSQSGTT